MLDANYIAKPGIALTADGGENAMRRFHVGRIAWHGVRLLFGAIGIVGGGSVFYYSEELMLRRIYLIGEENAFGRESVIRLRDGGTLLTNPGAMAYYALPFLGGAVVLMIFGVFLWYREYREVVNLMRGAASKE